MNKNYWSDVYESDFTIISRAAHKPLVRPSFLLALLVVVMLGAAFWLRTADAATGTVKASKWELYVSGVKWSGYPNSSIPELADNSSFPGCQAARSWKRKKDAETLTTGTKTYRCQQYDSVTFVKSATCPALPEARTQQCPTGTTGTWLQTPSITPAPQCTVLWTPTQPPAGACVAPTKPEPPTGLTNEVRWVIPTKNMDGTPLTNYAGVRLYYGTNSSALTSTVTVPAPATMYTFQNLSPGRYYVAARAYTVTDIESNNSNVVTIDVPVPQTGNWPQPPMPNMPSVSESEWVTVSQGRGGFLVGPDSHSINTQTDGTGSFRIQCDVSHMNYDDPLIYPGAANKGRAHHHTFWGNTSTWAGTDLNALRTQGMSTCKGGEANKSAYWVPSVIDTRSGKARKPDRVIVYYKSGYGNQAGPGAIQEFPQGLKMIAGTPMKNTPYSDSAQDKPLFHCHNGTPGPLNKQQTIPNCAVGSDVLAEISFPNCWDGVNLDSPDHKSHVTYYLNHGGRCPAGWRLLPSITFSIFYTITAADAPSAWVLSSDMKDANGNYRPGQSFHGDWINGWDVDIQRAWLNNCVRTARDCHADLLGDGRGLH